VRPKKKISKTTCLRTYVVKKTQRCTQVKSKQKHNIFENDVSKELFTSKEGQDSISCARYKNFESMQQKL